jgi:lysophospholipase I
VGGFSQGGAVALTTALRSKRKLAAVVGMSTWVPMAAKLEPVDPVTKTTRTLICGGDADNVVQPRFTANSAKTMMDLGLEVEFKSYAGLAHNANPTELKDVADFIKKALT